MSSKRGGQNVASANALPAVLQAPVPFAAVLGGRPASGAGRATAGVGGGKAGGGAKGAKQAGTAGAAEEIASGVEEEEDDDDDEGEQKKPGRRKISIQFISDKSKRHITFSKRKAGVIKKVPAVLQRMATPSSVVLLLKLLWTDEFFPCVCYLWTL